MRSDLNTLATFLAIAEERSFTKAAKRLGVSDSLVSDNRKIVEYELKKLKLSLEDASIFSEALRKLVSKRVQLDQRSMAAVRSLSPPRATRPRSSA